MPNLTLNSILKGAIPVFVGVAALGLALKYFGTQPVLRDVKSGLSG